MTVTPPPAPSAARIRKEIADAVVLSLREVTGRGPVRTRVMLSPESLVVFLENTLSSGERELVKAGFQDEVLALRSAYQQTMRDDLNRRISTIVGREVVTFMSTNSVEPDIAVEIFILGDPLD
jgi:uncharacterized protein YbcI